MQLPSRRQALEVLKVVVFLALVAGFLFIGIPFLLSLEPPVDPVQQAHAEYERRMWLGTAAQRSVNRLRFFRSAQGPCFALGFWEAGGHPVLFSWLPCDAVPKDRVEHIVSGPDKLELQ